MTRSSTLRQKATRFFATTLALTVMFTMCFATTAFASDGNSIGDPIENPGEIKIEKILQMPAGTTTPNATFEFEASKVSLDGNRSEANLAMMPNLNLSNNTVSYDNDDTDTPNGNNIISIDKLTGDILGDFPGAGIYEYDISEKNNTYATTANEILTYSKAVYTLRLYVMNNEEGGTDITAASIIVKTADNAGQTVGHKIDKMTFTNTYVKTNKPVDPENPDPLTEATLEVSNAVTGGSGNKSQYFDFTITPEVNELFDDLDIVDEFFRAYVVENGAVVDDITPNLGESGQSGTDEGGKNYILVSTNGETGFKLKDGQELVFVDTPVGTGYEATIAIIDGYDVSYIVTTDGDADAPVLADDQATVLSTGSQLVGEEANSADFTNYRDSVIPTGININNLPFIGLIALPIIGLILYGIFRLRKEKQPASK